MGSALPTTDSEEIALLALSPSRSWGAPCVWERERAISGISRLSGAVALWLADTAQTRQAGLHNRHTGPAPYPNHPPTCHLLPGRAEKC